MTLWKDSDGSVAKTQRRERRSCKGGWGPCPEEAGLQMGQLPSKTAGAVLHLSNKNYRLSSKMALW